MSLDKQNTSQADLAIGEQLMVNDNVTETSVDASKSNVNNLGVNSVSKENIEKNYLKYYSIFASIPFIGLFVYFFDKNCDDLVKNFAKQSNLLMILSIISYSFLLSPVAQVIYGIMWPLIFVLWLILVYNANNGLNFQFPFVGKLFDNLFN